MPCRAGGAGCCGRGGGLPWGAPGGTVRGSGRTGVQGWDGCSGGQEQDSMRGFAVAPVLPVVSQFGPSSCAVSPGQGHPCASSCLRSLRKQHFRFWRLLSFISQPAHANLLSGLGYLEMTLKGNPWTGIPTKPKVGSTPVSSHPCPHPHHATVMTILRGVSVLGCLVLHGVPMPRACLPAACPGRNVGAGLGVPVRMLEQGWVSQWGCGSRAGCPGRAGAGLAGAVHAAARFPRMKAFGWKLSVASCLLGAIRICRCLQCLMSSSRG